MNVEAVACRSLSMLYIKDECEMKQKVKMLPSFKKLGVERVRLITSIIGDTHSVVFEQNRI